MRYFLAALLAGPGKLSGVPVALPAIAAFGALGILHSPLWFLGALGALGFAFALATNERFRKVVDSHRHDTSTRADDYDSVVSQIKVETRSRLGILERKRERILEQQKLGGGDTFVIENNRAALDHLLKIFAKLLLSRQQLLTEDFATVKERIAREIETAQGEVATQSTPPARRAALEETIALQEERLKSLQSKQHKVEEIESDLKRIEAHFDLALSRAADHEKPQGITLDIGLASEGLSQTSTPPTEETTYSTTPPIQN